MKCKKEETCTIHSLIEERANQNPDSIALIFEGTQITYKELNERSNQLADFLRKKSVKPDDLIGIMLKRSPEMIIAMIGILKAGGAYLPIDPSYPLERIEYMLSDSGTSILLSQQSLDISLTFDGESIFIEDKLFEEESKEDLGNVNKSSNLAYVIYTSGSTGKPKGVMIEHKGVVNFFKGITDIIDFSPAKSILALASMSFDIFVLETLLALSRGLKVILTNENERNNPKLLTELFLNNKIDMFQVTPSRLQQLINYDSSLSILKNVKEIMVGAEPFPERLLEKLKLFKNLKIYNMYGPTETTVWCAVSCLNEANRIDIGKPISNVQIYIVDEYNFLLPEGNKGELCIAGDGVARGYINRPDLTNERFIPNPYTADEKMYKTGDMGRWLSNGKLECYGRIDNQVKIKGYRIELEEIEAQLLRYKDIKQAAVVAKVGKDDVNYLCAYMVHDKDINILELKDYLSKTLPNYMMPAYFFSLDKLPLTQSCKLDRQLLVNFDDNDPNNNATELNEIEKVDDEDSVRAKVIKTIKENMEGIAFPNIIEDSMSLFDIGFDSITYIWLISKLEEEFNFQMKNEVLDYHSFPAFKDLVSYVEEEVNLIEK